MVDLATPGATALARYEAVIGIEVHCQLRTASKMFCGCSTAYDGAAPNSHVCPVCLGLPGALPVINRRAVELVLATGLAIEAEVPPATRWDRKNYFYPDLPKGYQISQYDLPLASRGRLTFGTSDGPFTLSITRAHLEEDTAKLVHPAGPDARRVSLVDFNRSGVPLMEIVTEPEVRTAEQARRYAEELQLLLRSIGASDADMERGQLRVEANVSLRPRGTEPFGTRVEVKNMNSFRAVERAIEFEIERQAAALDAGEALVQETRGWSEERGETYRMRIKETSDDYRYFPEPDLPPLHIEPGWLDEIRAGLPELPAVRRARYQADLGLSPYDAAVLVADPDATGALRGARPRPRPRCRPSPSPTGSPGSTCGCARRPAPGSPSIRASSRRSSRPSRTGRSRAPTAARSSRRTWHRGTPPRRSSKRAGSARSRMSGRSGPWSTRSWRPTRPRSPTTGPARSRSSAFLVGQVMKATRGQANAAMAGDAVRARTRCRRGGGGLTRWVRSTSSCGWAGPS